MNNTQVIIVCLGLLAFVLFCLWYWSTTQNAAAEAIARSNHDIAQAIREHTAMVQDACEREQPRTFLPPPPRMPTFNGQEHLQARLTIPPRAAR